MSTLITFRHHFGQFCITCEGCGESTLWRSSEGEALTEAARKGWMLTGPELGPDLCPTCIARSDELKRRDPDHVDAMQDRETLLRIVALMDLREWSADTLADVGELLILAGFTVRDPNFDDDAEDPENEMVAS